MSTLASFPCNPPESGHPWLDISRHDTLEIFTAEGSYMIGSVNIYGCMYVCVCVSVCNMGGGGYSVNMGEGEGTGGEGGIP